MSLLDDVREAADDYRHADAGLREARAVLYARIRLAVSEGVPAAKVARAAGMSRQHVREIAAEASKR